jgi:ribosomal-protein-alanine N-acetyltransferase
VITLKDSGQLVGWCGAGPYERAPTEAELVYSLGKPHWGKGLATEAAGAVVRFCFENTEWDSIAAAIMPENIASRRVLEHLRFVYLKDVNYYELTGDTTLEMDSPIVPYFVLRREEFEPGATVYRPHVP